MMIEYQKWSPYVPKRKLPARGHSHIAVERQQDIDETGKPQTPRCCNLFSPRFGQESFHFRSPPSRRWECEFRSCHWYTDWGWQDEVRPSSEVEGSCSAPPCPHLSSHLLFPHQGPTECSSWGQVEGECHFLVALALVRWNWCWPCGTICRQWGSCWSLNRGLAYP